MRICVLYNHDLSSQTRVLRQIETLLDAGHDVTVYCLAEHRDRPQVETRGRLTIRRVWRKRLYKYHLFSYKLVRAFTRLAWSQPGYDAVHVIDAPMLLLGWLLARVWRSKLVYDAAEYWHALLDEEQGNIERHPTLVPGKRRIKLRQIGQTRAFERWVLPRCDGVISVCDSIGNLLQANAPKPIPRYITLRNIARYHDDQAPSHSLRDHYHLSPETRIIVYQGQIAKKRGLANAVEAIRRLQHVALIIIGPVLPADKTFFEDLQHQIATQPDLQGKVFYHGFVPADSLLAWTASADLGLHPIINWNMNHYLCLPNKLFEYLQAGLPVGVSHFPEMRQIVEDYQVGFVFDPDDPQEMAKAIQAFLDNPTRQATTRQNVQRAKHTLCWEQEEQKLAALYQAIFSPAPQDAPQPLSQPCPPLSSSVSSVTVSTL
jgi:glycosyltransferase involved in cell wall biosynthesis